ncbi:HipA domain-containing protein [Ruminococcus callidus]|uniref:HipA domain-containing protein n=2 Tax=Ruminococcus callidus TaxID=40519 RepID=UPI003521AD7A
MRKVYVSGLKGEIMQQIYNLDPYLTNERNGTYGGQAGEKEGITIDGTYWIVKYPKSTKGMRGDVLSYMTAPLSEYIGSHIYEILGIDVHQTILGIRNGKLVVACKDFCQKEGSLREIRTLKNVYNNELSKQLEESLSSTSDSHLVDLEEILLHLRYNPILSKVSGITERFWTQMLIDILINNTDRNNGNWGVLYENDAYRLAPVFDNGASFANKCTEKRLELMLSDETRIQSSIQNTATTYGLKGKPLLARDLETLKYPGLLLAEKRMIPVIQLKMQEIYDFIENIPEAYNGYLVCSQSRKQFYMKSMSKRLETFLLPALENAKQEILKKRRQNHLGL